MLLKQCKYTGLNMIWIVRKKEQAKSLAELGAKYVLLQDDPKFM